jgi:hypothetical protein
MTSRPRLNLHEYLQDIQRRPGMSLGGAVTLGAFEQFGHGYETALGVHDVDEWGNGFGSRFEEFLRRRFGWETVHGWAAAIRSQGEDEESGFRRFFELLDQFRDGGDDPGATRETSTP